MNWRQQEALISIKGGGKQETVRPRSLLRKTTQLGPERVSARCLIAAAITPRCEDGRASEPKPGAQSPCKSSYAKWQVWKRWCSGSRFVSLLC